MSVVLGIACEDKGHFSAVTRLVDNALVAKHDWLRGTVGDRRSWRGVKEGEDWYKYDRNDAKDLRSISFNGRTIKLHGHIDGKPLGDEARMWRRTLALFCRVTPLPEAVVLVRDLDGYEERLDGLKQVRDSVRIAWPFPIVIAAPEPEIEAWRASGFVPADVAEKKRLEALHKELSFDPTKESHRLTSHPNYALTDAKRVLERLCGTDPNRVDACLKDRAVLVARGANNGLKKFLERVDEHIVPLFSSPQ